MAVTLKGTFILIDQASETLRRIERQAKRTDDALEGAGETLDAMGDRDTQRNLDKTSANVRNLDRDSHRLQRTFRTLGRQSDDLDDKIIKLGTLFASTARILRTALIPAIVTLVGVAGQAIADLVGGVVALTPKIADLGGVVAGLGPILAGVAGTMGVFQLGMAGISDAVEGGRKEMKQLGPEAQRFVRTLRDAEPVLKRMRRSAQEGLLPGLGDALGTVTSDRVQGRLRGVLSAFGRTVGGGVADITDRVFSERNLGQLVKVMQQGREATARFFKVFGDLTVGLLDFLVAARPFTNWLERVIVGWADMWKESSRAKMQSEEWAQFFHRTRNSLERFGSIIENTWGWLRGLGQASRESGNDLWRSFDRATQSVDDFANSIRGQTFLRQWFASTSENFKELGRLVADLSKELLMMAGQPGLRRTSEVLRSFLPDLRRLLNNMSNVFGPALAETLGQITRLFANLAEHGGPFATVLNMLNNFLDLLNNLLEDVPLLGRVLESALVVGVVARFAAALRGLAASWGLVATSANAAAVAQGRATGTSLLGGLFGGRGRAGVPQKGVGGIPFIPGGMPAGGGSRLPGVLSRIPGATTVAGAASRIPGAARAGGALATAGGLAGKAALGVGRFLGPIGLGITGILGAKAAFDTEGGLDRKAQGVGSALTFGLIPGARSEEEAFLEGQQKSVKEILGDARGLRSVRSKIKELTNETLQADRWDAAELRGQLSTLRQLEDVKRPQKRQRQEGRAQELLFGAEGFASAFRQRVKGGQDPAAAFKATTADVTKRMEGLGPNMKKNVGNMWLEFTRQTQKARPKLKGLVGATTGEMAGYFDQLKNRVEIVNGRVLNNSELKWDMISKAIKRPAEKARQETTDSFTGLQRAAIGTLTGMGYSRADAQKIIGQIESGKIKTFAPGSSTEGYKAYEASRSNPYSSTQSRGTPRGPSGAPVGARGMRIPGSGMADTVPLTLGMAAPGELVVNRHTEQRINDKLMGRTTLGAEVAREGRPHSAPAPHRPVQGTKGGASWLKRHARGGYAEPPGDPGSEVVQAGFENVVGRFLRRYGMDLTQGYNPDGPSVSPGHKQLGVPPSLDVVPLSGDWGGSFLSGLRWALGQGMNVLYGSRGVGTPYPNHGEGNHAHIDWAGGVKGGKLQGGGMRGGGAAPQINLPRMLTSLKGGPGAGAQRGMDGIREGFQAKINAKLRRMGGGAGAGASGNVRQWLTQALRITGHYSPSNLQALLGRAMQESGGDPMAVNDWDSNAAAGTPSKGLLQTIGPTFDAYKKRGMSNIFNPVHNAVAAIRYMFAKYGHIVGPSGGGYAKGGRVPWFGAGGSFTAHGPQMIGVGERGPEQVNIKPMRRSAGGRGGGGGVRIGKIVIENHRKGDIEKQLRQEVGRAFERLTDELDEMGMEDADEVMA